MPTKSRIPWLLATLVLVAYAHCVFSHAREAVDQHRQLQSTEPSIEDRRATCENESSCICKGATLAIGVEAPAPGFGLEHFVCADSAAKWLRGIADSADRRILPEYGKPPILGSSLRAQLQCFLL